MINFSKTIIHYPDDLCGIYCQHTGKVDKIAQSDIVSPKDGKSLSITCISDTHSRHSKLQLVEDPTDFILHCGDFTNNGSIRQIEEFINWFAELPHKHKIVISGNRDRFMDMYCLGKTDQIKLKSFFKSEKVQCWKGKFAKHNIILLFDELIVIDGIRIYGSPWSPKHHNGAFSLNRANIEEYWLKIPKKLDILMTHGPPCGIGDYTSGNYHVGCVTLLKWTLERKPKYHLFGHIHEAYIQ
ncbi:hypothetical protein SNEBB_002122 [Seison nebaliae]|nr:hypothetical protein SNEBB_002122 [Seison nebaliae]